MSQILARRTAADCHISHLRGMHIFIAHVCLHCSVMPADQNNYVKTIITSASAWVIFEFLFVVGSPCLWAYMVWRLLSTKLLLKEFTGRFFPLSFCMWTHTAVVNRGEWLWNSSKLFVVCFCSLCWPWPCTKHNSCLLRTEELTNSIVLVS